MCKYLLTSLMLIPLISLSACSIDSVLEMSEEEQVLELSTADSDTKIASINVSNAQLIYKKEYSFDSLNTTPHYYKRDAAGKEYRLLVYDDTGSPTDIDIVYARKVSDNRLLFILDAEHAEQDTDETTTGVDTYNYIVCFVDINTENAYVINGVNWRHLINSDFFSDKDENIYACYPVAYKIDLNTLSVVNLLTGPQTFGSYNSNWYVTSSGFLLYGENVKCPAGKIINTGKAFAMRDKIYSLENDADTGRWTIYSRDEILQTNIAKNEITSFVAPKIYSMHYNPLRDVEMLVDSNNNLYEFDGTVVTGPLYNGYCTYFSRDAIYTTDETGFYRTEMRDYSKSFVDLAAFEIYSYTIDEHFLDISFIAKRISDGVIVSALVKPSGEIEILHTSSAVTFTNLLQLY